MCFVSWCTVYKGFVPEGIYNNRFQYFDEQLGIPIIIDFMHIVTNGKTSDVVIIQCSKNLYSATCVRVY